MPIPPSILVTGATGKTGRATVRALLERGGCRVRALVRIDDDRARGLRHAGAETIVGRLEDLRDVRRAMAGIQSAYFVAPWTTYSLDHALNFAVAAEEARVEHVVTLGQWLSSAHHPSAATRRTWLSDRVVSWIPEASHTIVNVGWFADNYMPLMGFAAQLGVLPMPLGSGGNPPVSNEDIGRVVAGALVDPETWAGRTLRPTGPRTPLPRRDRRCVRRGPRSAGSLPRHAAAHVRQSAARPRSGASGAPGAADVLHARVPPRHLRRGGTDRRRRAGHRPPPRGARSDRARRYAASDPMARRSLGNTLRALTQLTRIAMTPALDLPRWEREHGLPMLPEPTYCVDDDAWSRTHARHNAYGVAAPSPIRNAS